MKIEDFDFKTFSDSIVEKVVDGQPVFDLFRPALGMGAMPAMQTFLVTEYEEGRIDLVLNGMYGNLALAYADMDVILYINGIDNPLSIMKGDLLSYPAIESLRDFRYMPDSEKIDRSRRNRTLGIKTGQPNKSTRVDKKRQEYLDSVAFPPTVNQVPKQGVVVNDGKIKIGGIN